MAHREVVTSIQKQTKNRNETGSNLSLGTRLTVLSKRLGRKRCCDTTPDRCLEKSGKRKRKETAFEKEKKISLGSEVGERKLRTSRIRPRNEKRKNLEILLKTPS